jgi:hypothetical protein
MFDLFMTSKKKVESSNESKKTVIVRCVKIKKWGCKEKRENDRSNLQ